MNKQEAMERLDAMQKEMDALKAVIEAPEHDSILDPRWADDIQNIIRFVACPSVDYAVALATLLDLHTMDGTIKPEEDVVQYVLYVFYHNSLIVGVDTWSSEANKLNQLSPCFKTEEQAIAAIQKIGEDRLMHMFKTLHGVV